MLRAVFALSLLPLLASAQSDSIAPDQTDMSSLPASEFVKGMNVGWNVGNSLEAGFGEGYAFVPNETGWGNPKISQQLIDSVKAAGFNAIRLPVAWNNFSDASTMTIRKEWLDRVEEVVKYALGRDMYVVMNEHWDGGWLEPTNAAKAQATKQLAAIWKQVAVRFRNYNDRLIFAGTNEVMKKGDYGTPTAELVEVQLSYLQTFVTAVRSTGGRNAYRYLAVQSFNTNIDHAVSFFKLPADPAANRLILEVHYYDPYEFTLDEASPTITQWGAAGDPSKKAKWNSDETHATAQFNKMKTNFIDKGVPVILGEYGAMLKGSSDNPPFRLAWNQYITQAAKAAGMIPFFWDNGVVQANGFGLFDRNSGRQVHPTVVAAIVQGTTISIAPGPKPVGAFQLAGGYLVSENPAGIRLFDLHGRLTRVAATEGGRARLALAGLRPGVFFARIGAEAHTILVR